MVAPQDSLRDATLSDSLPTDVLWRIGVLALLVVVFYWTDLLTWGQLCLADKNWTHGFIIPVFSLYLLFAWRHDLLSARRRVFWPGLAVMVLAMLVRMYGLVVLQNNFLRQSSIVLMILGLTLFLAGYRVLRVALVPILYLLLAVPLPKSLYEKVALQLQNLAASMSTSLLRALGATIEVNASNMRVTSVSGQVHSLTVAEACSGVRSLMAFVALGVAMAYLERRPMWQRIVMILAGIPIAVIVNILRVAVTTTMFIVDKKELGEDFMHGFIGMLMLIPAMFLLLGLGKLLDMVYEDVDEDEEQDQENADAPKTDAPTAGTEGDA